MQDILMKNAFSFLAGVSFSGLGAELGNLMAKKPIYENIVDEMPTSYRLFANLFPVAVGDSYRISHGASGVFDDNMGWIAGMYLGMRLRNNMKGASRFYDVLGKKIERKFE